MANIAAQRIRREFKEVIRSEEVRDIYFRTFKNNFLIFFGNDFHLECYPNETISFKKKSIFKQLETLTLRFSIHLVIFFSQGLLHSNYNQLVIKIYLIIIFIKIYKEVID